jgi:NAD(P)-dependent dehydrogenase (short-subunit alcohol dehydrogenase family)
MYADLEGKVVMITGGGSGLGLAAAHAFADERASVVIVDLHADNAKACAKELGKGHDGLRADVAIEADVAGAVSATMAKYGKIDIVINSAGIPDTFRPTVEQDVADFRRLIDIHLTGTYMVSKAAAVHMLAQGSGSIINVSSVAGVLGLAPRNAYSAAKAGISMMTRTMGCEWASKGVRVNAVAPGYMLTPFFQKLLDTGKLDEKKILRRTPAGRFGSARNIADAMLFLASRQAEFITGVTLPVDGGYMAWGSSDDAFREPL